MIRRVRDEQRLGRAAFLGVTAVGLSSLLWGRSAWESTSRLIPNGVGAVLPQPTSGWRIYTVASTMPRIDPASYRLRVDGLVQQPVSLTLADLRALPVAEQVSDFHCVTGWSVDDVRWTGVRIRDVLAGAQARFRRPARWRSCRPSDPTSTRSPSTRPCSPTSCSPGRWTLGHCLGPTVGLSGS